MATIPQRELRNDISAVLRRAERGERLTITVDGRPVAELGPLTRTKQLASADVFGAILANTPVDASWAGELLEERRAEDLVGRDPWQE